MSFISARDVKTLLCLMLPMLLIASCSGGEDSFEKAQAAYSENKFRDARIYLLNELRDDPQNKEANILFANVMLRMADGASAQNALNKLPAGHEDLRAMQAQASILRGNAKSVLDQYSNINVESFTEQDWRMFIWAHFETDSTEQANRLLKTALARYPENSDLLSFAGNYQLLKLNNKMALEFADKALKFDEQNYEALNLGGRAALRSNEMDLAVKYYTMAYKFYPDNMIPAINLAGIALDRKDLNAALPYIEKAEKLNADLPFIKYIRARYVHESGDNQAAKTMLQDDDLGLGSYAPAILLEAKVLYELGEYEVATARAKRSLGIDARNVEAQKLLQKIAEKTGQ